MKQLPPDELSRYSRQIILREIGSAGQHQLRSARVLIIGLGGLGSPASLYLAAAGVGTLGLAEFDTVETHNLHRQILFDTASTGQPKLAAAEARLRALNPHCQLELHPEGLRPENALALFDRYDLIVDGSDNFGTRYLSADAAFLARKPLIYGSIFQFEGQVSCFDPAVGTPCYRCLFPEPPAPGTVPNCEEAGVFGALCGVIGSLQAMEAIKTITGAGQALTNRLLVVNALDMRFVTINLKSDPNCPLCGKNPRITSIDPQRYESACQPCQIDEPATMSLPDLQNPPFEIDVHQAQAVMEDPAIPLAILDVREDFEVAICALPDCAHIPMQQIPLSWEQLPRDRPILVYCHHGGRSGQVTRFLRARGLTRATNLAGGIDRWAREIDPSMNRY